MNPAPLPFLVLFAANLLGAALCAQNMLGISWSGDTYSIDAGSGAATFVGATGFANTNSMATANGALVTIRNGGAVISIDPTSGVGTLVGNLPTLTSVRGLANDTSSGALYAIADNGFTNGVANPDSLYLVDVAGGTAILVGDANHGGLQGFAIDGNGAAYAWDASTGTMNGAGLVTVDLGTGATFDVDPNVGGSSSTVQCLAFGPGGTLYGARYDLYAIDRTTGTLSAVGIGGLSDLRGIEFPGTVAAMCTTRTGAGINPQACTCVTLPRIGTSWIVAVQPGANTAGTLCLVSPAGLFPGLLLPSLGELLIDLPILSMPAVAPGQHALLIPGQPALAGFRMFAQGLRVDAGPAGISLQLTDAQDATVGP